VQTDERVAFGTLLRHFRAAAGLSQEALAERAGVSRRGIADLERGARRFPFGETARRLADALGLPPGDRATLINSAHKESADAHVAAPRLPAELSSLIGRQHELVELRRLLPTTRILTLTGPAGIGKTRLALELGRLVEPDFADGAVFVDLAPVLDPTLVAQALARAVGAREQANLPLVDTLQRHLAARQMLVIVDNCEHLLDAVARMVDLLARTCSRIKILATGREALHVRGEVAWLVPPLSGDDAARLFVERASAAQSTLVLGDDQTARIIEICQHLDGIPLAIELAAVRVPAIGLDQIAARLEHRLRLLASGNRLDAPRHQTLRAALDWSYDLLSVAERRLFERLAIFAGGWSLEAAESICAWEPIAALDVLGLLADLVARSLVVAEQHVGQTRYRLLEVIREYAGEQLESSGHVAEARQRHATYYAGLVDKGATVRLGLVYAQDMEALSREHANLRAALSGMLAHDEAAAALRFCRGLGGFWVAQGHLNEAQDWLDRLLALAEVQRSPALAETLHLAGRVAEYRGDYDQAAAFFERSLAVSRELEAPALMARALSGLGDVALHRGALDSAVDQFQDALMCARGAASWSEIAQALLSLGRVADAQGRTAESRQLLEESLAIQRRREDDWGVAYVLNELGQRACRDGQLEQAHTWHQESHLLWRKSGSRMGERAALMNLTLVSLARGDPAQAVSFGQACLGICQEIGDSSATSARCIEIGAAVLRGLGKTTTAVVLISAAATRRAALGAPVPPNESEAVATLSAARAELAHEDFERAWEDGARLSIHEAIALAGVALAAYGSTVSG
jgi:predicted ATPase/DNA-binding XRE family transcriptional regulator